jgi:hypothetical protein
MLPSFFPVVGLVSCLALAGCDAIASSPDSIELPYRLAPRIAAVSPDPLPAPAAPVTLTVSGANFRAGLILSVTAPNAQLTNFRDSDILQRDSSSFQVTVALDAPGTYFLVVSNADGAQSEPFRVTVDGSP